MSEATRKAGAMRSAATLLQKTMDDDVQPLDPIACGLLLVAAEEYAEAVEAQEDAFGVGVSCGCSTGRWHHEITCEEAIA